MHNENIYKKIKKIKDPITIEKFIEVSLYDEDGYYTNSNVLGSTGDFITSPEITQLFGEILGLYILDYWKNYVNKKFNLIELGPGRGTLLLDILKITEVNKSIIFIFNKIDLIENIKILPLIQDLKIINFINEFFLISSKNKEGIDKLLSYIKSKSYKSKWIYNQDEITDKDDIYITKCLHKKCFYFISKSR